MYALKGGRLERVAEVSEDGRVEGPLAGGIREWIERRGLSGEGMLETLARRWTNGYMAVELVGDSKEDKRSGGRGGRTYLGPKEEAPAGVEVHQGKRGGRWYEGGPQKPKDGEGQERERNPYEDYAVSPRTHRELFDWKWHTKNLGEWRSLVEQTVLGLPLEHAALVSAMEVLPYRGKGVSGQFESMIPGAFGMQGSAPGRVLLRFRGGPWSETFMMETVAHEIGHAVYKGIHWGSKPEENELRKEMRQEYHRAAHAAGIEAVRDIRGGDTFSARAVAGARRGHAVSPYALKNDEEFFAEHYAWYRMHPTSLQRLNPQMYGLLREEVFGGRDAGAGMSGFRSG